MKSAVTAYVPAFVCVAAPPSGYCSRIPAQIRSPWLTWQYRHTLTGELVTDTVGVTLLMTKFPAEAAVRLL